MWGIVCHGSDYNLFPLSKYISSYIIKMHHKVSLCRKLKNRTLVGQTSPAPQVFFFPLEHSFTLKNVSRPMERNAWCECLLIAPNSSYKLLQKQFSIFSARLIKKNVHIKLSLLIKGSEGRVILAQVYENKKGPEMSLLDETGWLWVLIVSVHVGDHYRRSV